MAEPITKETVRRVLSAYWDAGAEGENDAIEATFARLVLPLGPTRVIAEGDWLHGWIVDRVHPTHVEAEGGVVYRPADQEGSTVRLDDDEVVWWPWADPSSPPMVKAGDRWVDHWTGVELVVDVVTPDVVVSSPNVGQREDVAVATSADHYEDASRTDESQGPRSAPVNTPRKDQP